MTLIELAKLFRESRDFYASIGWRKDDCSIHLYGGILKLSSDIGCDHYTIRNDGWIVREAMGARSKLIEFVTTDCQVKIDYWNRLVRVPVAETV